MDERDVSYWMAKLKKKSLCYESVKKKPYELFSSSVDLLSKIKETRQTLKTFFALNVSAHKL